MSRAIELRAGPRYRVVELDSAPPESGRSRAAKQFESSLEREATNVKTARMRLELLLYANFTPDDWFVTLTYDNAHLPPNYHIGKRYLPAYMRKLRETRRTLGIPCRYVYVMEGMHGDHRIHHHMVINRDDLGGNYVTDLWTRGKVDLRTIEDFGGIKKVADYITKEPRKTGKLRVGQRMWTPSRGLIQPEKTVFDLDPGEHYPIPSGAQPVEGGRFPETVRNNYGSYILYDFVIKEAGENAPDK